MINEEDIIELVDEDGNEVQFGYEATITMDGNDYVVLIPLEANEESDEDDDEYEEVVILKVEKGEDGEDSLVTIEDEEEEKKVFDTFYKQREEEFDIEE
jgi:uncharacterized protein YrzB (UPF0473 family)